MTTWIGYEVGLIGEAVSRIETLDAEPYLLFLSTVPYSFYPILAIAFVFMIASSGRDFGPMLAAERRAASGRTGFTSIHFESYKRQTPPKRRGLSSV